MTNIQLAVLKLKQGETLKIEPMGTSMCPLFMGGRDSVEIVKPDFPLKRGDIAVFQRKDGTYVIHRVRYVKKVSDPKTKEKTEVYYMIGDNQTETEGPVDEAQIHGVAVYLQRKGKRINLKTNIIYKIYSALWLGVVPLRTKLMRAWSRLSAKKLSK